MPNKFYDIIPPRKTVLEEKEEKTEERKPQKKSRRVFLKSLIFSILGLVVVAFVGFFFFSDIKIEIWPQKDSLDFDYKLSLKESVEGGPEEWVETGVLPLEKVDVKKTKEKTFSSTGKKVKESRAEGVITVYNAHSTYNQTLVANTRFVSSEGKLFRTKEREVIEGGHYEGGEFVPGQTDIEVWAAEAGEKYNIGPSTFSIPAWAGTERYTTFYGKSFSDMKGGFKGEVAQVKEEDLNKAESEVISELKEENIQFLGETLSESHILLSDSLSHEVLNKEPSKEKGEEGDSFDYKVEVKSQGLAVDKENMEEFALLLIESMVSEEMRVLENSLELDFSVGSLNSDEVSLNLTIKAVVFKDINLEKVKRSIAGQGLNEAKLFLGRLSGVKKVEVKSWPFWRRSLPDDIKEINLELILDQ